MGSGRQRRDSAVSHLMRVGTILRAAGPRLPRLCPISEQPFAGLADHGICEYPAAQKPLAVEITASHFCRDANGEVAAPDAPGLGIEVDEEAVGRYSGGWKSEWPARSCSKAAFDATAPLLRPTTAEFGLGRSPTGRVALVGVCGRYFPGLRGDGLGPAHQIALELSPLQVRQRGRDLRRHGLDPPEPDAELLLEFINRREALVLERPIVTERTRDHVFLLAPLSRSCGSWASLTCSKEE